jgi:iron(III) transport system permease protein
MLPAEAAPGPKRRGAAGSLTHTVLGPRRPPTALLIAGVIIAAAAALPAAYLAIAVAGEVSVAVDAIWSSRTLALLARSAGLALAVTAAAIALAVPLAWLTTRTDLPARRLWATLTTLPLVIPSYIGAYLFVSALGPRGSLADLLAPFGVERLPSIYGFPGAWLVLTLFTYPLVLLSVRASLARLDPQLEEASRNLGRTPAQTFRGVVLPQLLPAIAAGGLLVALYAMSDFGAVSIMRFDSFTREIYVSYSAGFGRTEAAALGLVLVAFMLALLWLQGRARGALALHRAGPGTKRPARTVPLGPWKAPALAFCAVLVLVALVIPVGVLVYWSTKGISSGIELSSVATYAGNSLLAASAAAALGAVAALAVSLLAVRFPSPLSRLVERLGYAGYALPGIVVALALVFFATRVALPLYQTLGLLVFALTVHYLPLAVAPLASSLVAVSPRVEEAARGLGRRPLGVFRTITTPLVAGGMLAGTALVFLHAIKELPATLLLAPIGFETLATDIWRQTSFGFFEASAIPALVLLIIAAPPLYLLSEKGTITS